MDLAAITSDGNDDRVVRILQNDGSMSFTSIDTASGEDVVLIDAGDVSGDGTTELVTISGRPRCGGDARSCFQRELDSVTFCDGDVDASGEVDVLDLLEVLSNWDCEAKCIGDANDDGVVDVLDLLMVIGNWGYATEPPRFRAGACRVVRGSGSGPTWRTVPVPGRRRTPARVPPPHSTPPSPR